MSALLKIFTTIFFTLASLPVLADALEDKLQKDIDALTRAYDEHIQKLQNVQTSAPTTQTNSTQKIGNRTKNNTGSKRKGMICTNAKEHHLLAKYDENQKCIVESCVAGWEPNTDKTACIEKTKTPKANLRTKESDNNNTQEPQVAKVGDPCERDHAISAKYKKTGKNMRDCMVIECEKDYKITSDGRYCEKKQSDIQTYTTPENEKPNVTNIGEDCTAQIPNARIAKINDKGECIVDYCNSGFRASTDDKSCIETIQVSTPTQTKKNKKKTFNYLDPDTIETTNYKVAYGEVYLLNSEDVKFLPNLGNHDSSMECPEISEGEWCALYNTTPQETIIIGNYQCNNSTISRNDNDIVGPHCWCGSTEPMGYWVYFGSYRDANDCDKNCAIEQCIKVAADTKDGLRSMLTDYNLGTINEDYSTTISSDNTDYNSQKECEEKINAEFANGVPTKYEDTYLTLFEKTSNKQITGGKGDHVYIQPTIKNTPNITCKPKNNDAVLNIKLKDCEGAAQTLPKMVEFLTRETIKNKVCGYKKGRFTDIVEVPA